MMEVLPSYNEATSPPDWLELVAPYVPTTDWKRCCLVGSNFYRHFVPRLWLDPLVTVRELGLHPNDDLTWYRHFINRHMKSVRPSTRILVHSLDFRNFALTASGLYSTDASERSISESFRDLPRIFPGLLCLLVDGHPELDPGALVQNFPSNFVDRPQSSLQLLDLAHCPHELTPKLFKSDYLRNLVYLDISWIPGSIKTAVQSTLNPQHLPSLRILKVQGREIDDLTAFQLFQTFQRHLWSLDISQNKLTDASLAVITDMCLSSLSFRSDSYFQTEGKLTRAKDIGSAAYGMFDFVEESDFSSVFGHTDSFMADTPLYSSRADRQDLQEWQVVRSDGLARRRQDNADEIKQLLLNDIIAPTVTTSGNLYHNVRSSQGGITHLYLSGNQFTSAGLERLLRVTLGRLEHIDCGSVRFSSPDVSISSNLPKSLLLFGMLGSAHLFRPVFSSSLRSLLVHHSVVTHIPTLRAGELTARTANFLAETAFHERISMAFPQTFIPSMNPRIASITLTSIPTRSSGPLIDEIIKFLDQASVQQQAIEKASALFNRRGPSVLSGIRHIRLELEPDHSAESPSMASGFNTNMSELLDPASSDFSHGTSDDYYSDDWGITSRGPSSCGLMNYKGSESKVSRATPEASTASNSASSALLHSNVGGEHIIHRVDSRESWNGKVFTVPVWVGTGVPGPHPAVNEYMSNLQDLRLHSSVGPASPSHVLAGIPWGSYIFYAAWDSMIFPRELPKLTGNPALDRIRDVASAIKEYRMRTRRTPEFWTGKLELVRASSASRYQSSDYWR